MAKLKRTRKFRRVGGFVGKWTFRTILYPMAGVEIVRKPTEPGIYGICRCPECGVEGLYFEAREGRKAGRSWRHKKGCRLAVKKRTGG